MEWEQPGQRRRRHLTRLHANGSSHPARRTNRCTQRASGPAAECSGTPCPISPYDARGVSSVEKALLSEALVLLRVEKPAPAAPPASNGQMATRRSKPPIKQATVRARNAAALARRIRLFP